MVNLAIYSYHTSAKKDTDTVSRLLCTRLPLDCIEKPKSLKVHTNFKFEAYNFSFGIVQTLRKV